MTILAPLGFLAAIAIVILIIIYIIRPNYQQKYVSSTFVWKLSLKYKKKRIPTSKLRDILIIFCQIASLACCAAILAQPVKMLKAEITTDEIVIVLDASASMTAGYEEDGQYVCRYSRALDMIETQAKNVLETGGYVSLIRADDDPSVVLDRITKNEKEELTKVLESLAGSDSDSDGFSSVTGCGYGGTDLTKAMSLCENILDINPSAVTYLYTDLTILSKPDTVIVVDCRPGDADGKVVENNIGILDVVSEFIDGSYVFNVKVASYDVASEFGLKLEVLGVPRNNYGEGGSDSDALLETRVYKKAVNCNPDEEKVITFKYIAQDNLDDGSMSGAIEEEGEDEFYFKPAITAYTSARISIINIDAVDQIVEFEENIDKFSKDDVFTLPSSRKPVLNVLYASSLRTPFFEGILDILEDPAKSYFNDLWNIKVERLRPDKVTDEELDKKVGYDFYIFEGRTPKDLPTDGAVLLFGVETLPKGVSGRLGGEVSYATEEHLTSDNLQHPVMRNLIPDNIFVTRTRTFIPDHAYDESDDGSEYKYDVLMQCSNGPVLSVRKAAGENVAIVSFSSYISNSTINPEFPFLIVNLINYFLPSTIERNLYAVGEEFALNCRGASVSVQRVVGEDEEEYEEHIFTEFPSKIRLHVPGEYNVVTYLDEDGINTVTQNIVVRLPAGESKLNDRIDSIDDPYHGAKLEDFIKDLIVYVAAALIFFLFAEWLLHLREGI